jgi:hypothetical protein
VRTPPLFAPASEDGRGGFHSFATTIPPRKTMTTIKAAYCKVSHIIEKRGGYQNEGASSVCEMAATCLLAMVSAEKDENEHERIDARPMASVCTNHHDNGTGA